MGIEDKTNKIWNLTIRELKDICYGFLLILLLTGFLVTIIALSRSLLSLTAFLILLTACLYYYLKFNPRPTAFTDYEKDKYKADIFRDRINSEDLTAEDFREIISELSERANFYEEIVELLDGRITEEMGNKIYRSIIAEMEEKGGLEEVREDLIDPDILPCGRVRISQHSSDVYESEESFKTGYIPVPDKNPTSLRKIEDSVIYYLMSVGRGFLFDGERINSVEKDYKEFLEDVISLDEEFEGFELEVELDERLVTVKLKSDDKSYGSTFRQPSDWVNYQAFKPLEEALDFSKTIYATTDNDGSVLILTKNEAEIFEKYFKKSIIERVNPL